jgi:Fic family protein
MKPFVPTNLPIEGIRWAELVPTLGKANRALAHYDGVLLGVPNPDVLLSPLTTQEAVLSSKIEGTQATLGEVLRFEAGDAPEKVERRNDIHEILNYRRALRVAESGMKERPFNLNLIKQLHEILLDSVRGKNKTPGRFRTTQNWIGTPGSPIEEAQFVPPDPMRLHGLMDNWEKYYHYEERDPLVQLALVHAQFEIIHPFNDGNGRLGRIVIPLFLFEKELLRRPMFYLSSYLDENRDAYIDHLRALDDSIDSWQRWVVFFLEAVVEQARINSEKAKNIMLLYEQMKERVICLTHSQFAIPLLDNMFQSPIFTASQLNFGDNAPSRQALAGLIRALRDDGVLSILREGKGRRPHVWLFSELMNLCEA